MFSEKFRAICASHRLRAGQLARMTERATPGASVTRQTVHAVMTDRDPLRSTVILMARALRAYVGNGSVEAVLAAYNESLDAKKLTVKDL
jgi:hypothetical protein